MIASGAGTSGMSRPEPMSHVVGTSMPRTSIRKNGRYAALAVSDVAIAAIPK